MLKICANGHVTGYKKCSFCRAATELLAAHPPHRALDKRFKRRVTQAIRDAGGIPAADLRRSYWRIKPGRVGIGDSILSPRNFAWMGSVI